jgi:hypothetical protein
MISIIGTDGSDPNRAPLINANVGWLCAVQEARGWIIAPKQ